MQVGLRLACLVQVLVFIQWGRSQNPCCGDKRQCMKEDREKRWNCTRPGDICYALLKIGGTIIPQEPTGDANDAFLYCGCKDGYVCNTTDWETKRGKHLTFYHHERIDWLVQFKFCKAFQGLRTCQDKNEYATAIRTTASCWDPRVTENACQCRNSVYFMKSWHFIPDGRGKQAKDGEWEYKYMCDRPQCKDKEEPCQRHYVDRSALHTVGYEFLCSCPRGTHCAVGSGPIKSYEVEGEDNVGIYKQGKCEKLVGWEPQPIDKE